MFIHIYIYIYHNICIYCMYILSLFFDSDWLGLILSGSTGTHFPANPEHNTCLVHVRSLCPPVVIGKQIQRDVEKNSFQFTMDWLKGTSTRNHGLPGIWGVSSRLDFPLKCYDISPAPHEELINATLSPTVVTYNSTISAFGTSAHWEV